MATSLKLPSTRLNRTLFKRIQSLSDAVAVSGDEGSVRQLIKEELTDVADDMQIDSMGNLLVLRRGRGRNRKRVMLAAHMDEVGFMVTGTNTDGHLNIDSVGGIDARYLPGKPVWIGRDRVEGIVGMKPIHLTSGSETSNWPKIKSMNIDIGAGSKDSASESASTGMRGTFAARLLNHNGVLRGKALDDRLGVATLIETVLTPPPAVDILAAFTVQEEVGLRGARIAAFTFKPDLAIALDCTPAMDQPRWDGDENTSYNTKLGAGPAIYTADGSTISNPHLIEHFASAGRAQNIPYQLRQPGGGGTDAGAIHLAREGIPSVSISVPGRYLHAPFSLALVRDWRASSRLLYAGLTQISQLPN